MATSKCLEKSSSVAVTSEPENPFECPICYELLKTPRGLPCYHTFCETCLQEYISTTHTDGDPVTFLCPCCRKKLDAPDSEAPVAEWARKFPLNRWVLSAMKSTSGPETKIQMCGPCNRDEESESTPALHWCSQCNEGLCDTCMKYHKRYKENKSHNVIPITDVEKVVTEQSNGDMCPNHDGEIWEYYCKDHKTLCCKLCQISVHQTCTTLPLEEMADDDDSLLNIDKMINDLNSLDNRAKLSGILQRENLEKLTASRNGLKDRMSKAVTDFNNKLDNLFGEKQMELDEKQNKIKILRNTLSEGIKMLTGASEFEKKTRKIKAAEKVKTWMREEAERLQLVVDKDNAVEITLPDNDIFEKLCHLEFKASESDHSLVTLVKHVDAFSNPVHVKPGIDKLRIEKLFEITTTESQRWFTGGVFLKDDRLLFADRHNKKLRLYDSLGTAQYERQLNYRPWDVVIGDASNRVLVSDTETALIRTYIISETDIREGNSIKVSNTKEGIDTIGNQILCVDGQKVEFINYDGTSKVLQLKCGRYICVSKENTNLYCCRDNEVACHSVNGDKVFVYTHPELKSPRGIALDIHGNAFICGSDSENLHVVSEDGKQSVIFLSKVLGCNTGPHSIGINNTGEKLFIASWHEKEPIEILKLSYD